MSRKLWSSLEEIARAAREGIIDESRMRERPDAETLEAIRADLEQFEAKYHAKQQAAKKAKTARQPA
jgi:hypothetical protein